VRWFFVNGSGRVRSGWVVLTFALTAAVVQLVFSLIGVLFVTRPLQLDQWQLLFLTWPTFLGAIAATAVCVKAFSEDLGLQAPRTFWRGVGLGAAALALAAGLPALVGGHGTLGWPRAALAGIAYSGALQFISVAPTSVAEELLFRGVAFRALSRGTHPLFAILVTSVLFGAIHLLNPNASLVAAANVALVGVWFGLVAWRISLWASIGLHVSWNWFEGFVFGQPVSGIRPGASLLFATWPPERSFWSGGDFGPEASGWTCLVLFFSIALIALLTRPTHRPST
jgi:membrane protease YdiL (CAAX protease family)